MYTPLFMALKACDFYFFNIFFVPRCTWSMDNFMTDTMEGYKAQSASLVYTKYNFYFYFLCVWVLDNDYMIVLFDGF